MGEKCQEFESSLGYMGGLVLKQQQQHQVLPLACAQRSWAGPKPPSSGKREEHPELAQLFCMKLVLPGYLVLSFYSSPLDHPLLLYSFLPASMVSRTVAKNLFAQGLWQGEMGWGLGGLFLFLALSWLAEGRLAVSLYPEFQAASARQPSSYIYPSWAPGMSLSSLPLSGRLPGRTGCCGVGSTALKFYCPVFP